MTDSEESRFHRHAMSVLIRVVAVFVIAAVCWQIVRPFIGIVAWAIILAVAIYPAHLVLSDKLGGRQKLSATLIVILGLLFLFVPVWFGAGSTIDSAQALSADLRSGSITISPPGEKVRDWPIIGERVHSVWSEAADGVEAVINEFEPQLKEAGQWLVGAAGSVVGGVLHFAVSLIVVGVLLLNAHGAYSLSCALATKIAGERGPYLTDLSIAIVRSVTKGVLGVALIQALLSTIGLMVMGVPAAGILGAIVLVTAIVQIPTLLIMGPIVFWVFSFAEPVPATIFAVYALLVSLSDNVLKPMLLGRGVDAPMLVILIGAIGGAIAGGLIGLFVGAVILALGYAIFDDWLNHAETNEASDRDTSPA